MKSIKCFTLLCFLATALLTVSCLGKSGGDSSATQEVCALYKPDGTLVQADGGILVPTNPTVINTLMPGMYMLTIQFDPMGWENNKLPVTITTVPKSVENHNVLLNSILEKGNIPLYDLNYRDQMYPIIFDADNILVPVIYWCEDSPTEEAAAVEFTRHTFALCTNMEESEEDVLEFFLVDEVKDIEISRVRMFYKNQGFNISNAVAAYKRVHGAAPKKIRISAFVNDTKCDLSEASGTKKESVDLDYSAFK